MPDQIEDERNASRVLEGDFTKQGSLKASSIWERSIFVQKVTVLLSWKSLTNNFCFIPTTAGYKAITDTEEGESWPQTHMTPNHLSG